MPLLNAAPAAPTIKNFTYSSSRAFFTLQGQDIPLGATFDFSKFIVVGEDGARYSLSSAQEIKITEHEANWYFFQMPYSEHLALSGLFNKEGTQSAQGASFQLILADGWTSGGLGNGAGQGMAVNQISKPLIHGATYDGERGTLNVWGQSLASTPGGANDIQAGKFTLHGQGQQSYTLSSSANVELTSTSSFTLTLSAADRAAVERLLNQNGEQAADGTPFTLDVADDWDGPITGGDIAASGKKVEVRHIVPEISGASYDAASGKLTVSARYLRAADGASDIVASKLTLVGEDGRSVTLSDSADVEIGSGEFTLQLSARDRAALSEIWNRDGNYATGGNAYQIKAAEGWNAGVPAGVAHAELAGKDVAVSAVAAPVITGANYDAARGVLTVTGSGFSRLSGTDNDVRAGRFTLYGEDGAKRQLSDTADVDILSSTSFTLTLSDLDRDALNLFVNRDGASASDGSAYYLTADEHWAAGAGVGVNVADLSDNPVTVSNVARPTITAARYKPDSGVLVVTGSGFVQRQGEANDIVASKFRLTGLDGKSHTLSSSLDVDVQDGTTFTLKLSAEDQAAVALLLGKEGDQAADGTAYNLAAAEDWAAGAAPAVVLADLTGNAVTVVRNAAPTLSAFATMQFDTPEDDRERITLDDLLDTGDEADSDGAVVAFVVKQVLSGELRIGTGSKTATAWAAGSNDVIDATHKAYWYPAANAHGAALPAFTAVARDSDGADSPVATRVTVQVKAVNDEPAGAVRISGKPAVGQTLSADTATLADADGLGALHYQWQADGADIAGATGATLLLQAALLGKAISVVVSYTDGDGSAERVVSAASAKVDTAAPPQPPVDPAPRPVLVDGASVLTEEGVNAQGQRVSTTTIAPVAAGRQEDSSTPNKTLADVALAQGGDGATALSASLPAGLGLVVEAVRGPTVREQLVSGSTASLADAAQLAKLIGDGIDQYVAGLRDESQVTVRTLELTAAEGASSATAPALLINGASGTGNADAAHPLRQEALVIDSQRLPPGSELRLEQVEFAAVIGNATVRSSGGASFLIGDGQDQTFVFGPAAGSPRAAGAAAAPPEFDQIVHAGGGRDVVRAAGGNDKLYGDAGQDLLYGGGGTDLLDGGAGDDLLLGGKAADTVVYAGQRSQYEVKQEFGKCIVRDLTGKEGSDTLVNVEKLQFADQSMDLADATAGLSWIATLYQQVLGRQAELDGFQHWAAAASRGLGVGEVALGFLRSAELQAHTKVQFDTLDRAAQVDFFYQHLLGREAEASGKAFWLHALEQRGFSLADVAKGFVESVELTGQYLAPTDWDFTV